MSAEVRHGRLGHFTQLNPRAVESLAVCRHNCRFGTTCDEPPSIILFGVAELLMSNPKHR